MNQLIKKEINMAEGRHYLKFPDDFRDQLITQKSDFVPFDRNRSKLVTTCNGDIIRQTKAEQEKILEN